LEVSISKLLLGSLGVLLVESHEKFKGALQVGEGTLNSVSEFDDDLAVPVEGSEGVLPVIFSEVSLPVGVDFTEQFLKQRDRHVEPSQGVVSFHEQFELLKRNLLHVLRGLFKRGLDRGELLRDHKSDLLDG
jgi:hypothetical protein